MRTEKDFSESFLCWVSKVLNQGENHLVANVTEKDSSNSLEQTGGISCEPVYRATLQVENSMIIDFLFIGIDPSEA
jgi:hypothetical protein